MHTSHFKSYFQIKIHITTYFVLLFLIKTKVYGIYKIEVNCSGWINNFLFVVIDTHAGLAAVCSCTALCFRRFSQMRGKIPTTGSQSHAFRINVKDLTVFAILPFGSAFQDKTWYCSIWVHIKTFSLIFWKKIIIVGIIPKTKHRQLTFWPYKSMKLLGFSELLAHTYAYSSFISCL